jgi:hypothetical protein
MDAPVLVCDKFPATDAVTNRVASSDKVLAVDCDKRSSVLAPTDVLLDGCNGTASRSPLPAPLVVAVLSSVWVASTVSGTNCLATAASRWPERFDCSGCSGALGVDGAGSGATPTHPRVSWCAKRTCSASRLSRSLYRYAALDEYFCESEPLIGAWCALKKLRARSLPPAVMRHSCSGVHESISVDRTKLRCVPRFLWSPAQSMQRNMPYEVDAQVGWCASQSKQNLFSGLARSRVKSALLSARGRGCADSMSTCSAVPVYSSTN